VTETTTPLTASDTADLAAVAEVSRRSTWFDEIGSPGLKRAAGYVDEEFLPQLRGRKAVQVYREMADNDPIVGALLFAITQLVRGVDWSVTPAGKNREAAQAAKLVETCRDDMSVSWGDFIGEALTMIPYGWAWHEIVYKRRVGPWERDGKRRSKHADGLIGWRRLPLRGQETMLRWVFDANGSVAGMVQMAPPDYSTRTLPTARSLLFRTTTVKDNPEGRSMLRNAYRPWFYKKRLEEFEAVGVERDLAGLPMVSVPAAWLKARPGSEQHKQVQAMQKMVRSMRRNEQEGIVFPLDYDETTRQPMFKMELLGSGGGRAFSTNDLIQRYEQRILMTVLADFIMVGHQRVGTYNLHVDKTGMFRAGLNALKDSIADVLNRYAIPKLFLANGWKPVELPKFTPGDVDAPDLAQLAQFLSSTAGLGFSWGPDADMERYLRDAAGMPSMGEDDYAAAQREARMAEATRIMTVQTEQITARQGLAQARADEQMQAAGEPTPEDAQVMAQAEQGAQQQQAEQEDRAGARQMQRVQTVSALQSLVNPAGGGQTDRQGRR
jgi:hypothetical protein